MELQKKMVTYLHYVYRTNFTCVGNGHAGQAFRPVWFLDPFFVQIEETYSLSISDEITRGVIEKLLGFVWYDIFLVLMITDHKS